MNTRSTPRPSFPPGNRLGARLPAPSASLLIALALGVGGGGFAAEFEFNGRPFTVPEGFELTEIAGPPLVDRPIVADFDEQGRLYVADSSGSNEKVDLQLQTRPHRIVRLEDVDGDGVFDRSVVFADKMMFPEGTMWYRGSLYVSAPPSIWKLTDTNGDGIADQREEWMQGKTLTGCANDLHGPYRGPDGWIYWCKGAFAKQTHENPGRAAFVTRAAHIFRARPDGTGIEPVMTGGMDNPVDVTFTAEGERIFTTTFFQHPGGGQRDGLIHAIYGGVYGKVHDVIDEHPRTGEVLPVLTHMGPAAPSGLTRYQSGAFGSDYTGNLFACQFNMHKVSRHILTPQGSTYTSKDSDFLASSNPDFHPTDVVEDADGSLIVVDTGGWYKICCPTSQLWKPDVLGAIYRVRRRGAASVPDPRGRELEWARASARDLADRLADRRPAVRERATDTLARRGESSVAAIRSLLDSRHSADTRLQAVWALCRIDDPKARAGVRTAIQDKEPSVQHAAAHAAAVWRDREAVAQLAELLRTPTPALRRVAAEALGRIGDRTVVPALLAASAAASDRALEHSVTFALIELAEPQSTLQGLAARNTGVRRAALLALDQMQPPSLKPEQAVPLLADPDPAIQTTARWIIERRPAWGAAVAAFLRQDFIGRNPAPDTLQSLLSGLVRNPEIQQWIGSLAVDAAVAPPLRFAALRTMGRSGLRTTPASWMNALQASLASSDPHTVQEAVAAVRALPFEKQDTSALAAALLRIAEDVSRSDDVRLGAMAAVPGGLQRVEPGLFSLALAVLDPAKDVGLRNASCTVLTRARLQDEQALALADRLQVVGPLEIARLLPAFDAHTNAVAGARMLAALRNAKGLAGLHPGTLKARLEKFPAPVRAEGASLLARLDADAAKQVAHLDSLLHNLGAGDVRKGQAVFNSTKAACSACHAIGYLGGDLGPDLTRIGQIRNERDLLEAIVFPNASFVRSYEPIIVATRDGEEYSGVLRRDAPDEVVLGTGPGAEMRVPRSNVADVRPGQVSVMPGGLDEQLSKAELADLLAFLKATKW